MDSSTIPMERNDICYSSFPYGESPYSRDSIVFQPIHHSFPGGIESYLDPKYASDPAAFASRLPYFPFHPAYGVYDFGFEPAFIRKRNERERQRVKCVNEGYARLREHLPLEFAEKRLSKVETLRGAIQYIKHLQNVLGIDEEKEEQNKSITHYKQRKQLRDCENEKNEPDIDGGSGKSEGTESLTKPSTSRNEYLTVGDEDDSNDASFFLPVPKIKIEASSPTTCSKPCSSDVQSTSSSSRTTSVSCNQVNTVYPAHVCSPTDQTTAWKTHSNVSNIRKEHSCLRASPIQKIKENTVAENLNIKYSCQFYGISKNTCTELNAKQEFCEYTDSQYSLNQKSNYIKRPRFSDNTSVFEPTTSDRGECLQSSYFSQKNKTQLSFESLQHLHRKNHGFAPYQHTSEERRSCEYAREIDSDGFKSDSSPYSGGTGASPHQ